MEGSSVFVFVVGQVFTELEARIKDEIGKM